MEKKFIHIKLPEGFFDSDPEGSIHLIKALQQKIEEHGELGQYCVFATDASIDISCLNDEELIIELENLISPMLLQEHLKDGLKSLFTKVLKALDGSN
jgi:hypothetical protein